MTTWTFYGVEFGVYAIFAQVVYLAWRTQRGLAIAGGVIALFGYAVELAFKFGPPDPVEGMDYGDFLIMLPGHIPLWIPLGWGALVTAAMRNTNHFRGSMFFSAVNDGLLASTLALALDPTASVTGWYKWHNEGAYFGAPVDHILLYFGLAGSLSLFVRLGWAKWIPPGSRGAWGDLIVPIAAAVGSFVFMIAYGTVLNYVYVFLGGTEAVQDKPWSGQTLAFFLVMLPAGVYVVMSARLLPRAPSLQWGLLALPLFFFNYMVVVCIADGLFEHHPELIVSLGSVLSAGLIWWALPYAPDARVRTAPTPVHG
jgi:uncharacterized membrane protein